MRNHTSFDSSKTNSLYGQVRNKNTGAATSLQLCRITSQV